MKQNTIVEMKKPEAFVDDLLTAIVSQGARDILAKALEMEIHNFISQYANLKDGHGKQRVTRNGYLSERDIQTGVGPVLVKVPQARERNEGSQSDKIHFCSSIVPTSLRKTKSMEALIPWLYLKGISTRDFSEALSALVGKDAP